MKKMFGFQFWHAFILVILLIAVGYGSQFPNVLMGQLFGLSTSFWFWLAVAAPIIHQVYVVFFWRGELYTNWMSKRFASREAAFNIFARWFYILILSRPVTITLLAIANREQLAMGWGWRLGLGIPMFALVAWMGYSIKNYFGVINATGRDHFFPEEYRGKSLEKRGIFKYIPNSMYTVGFFIVWLPGVLLASPAALLVAVFSHVYIWVHWFTVEKPDMQFIYGDQ